MPHPDAVMIFAAGFGTRMGALTRDRPKPLIEVAGRALIDHALDQAHGRRIVLNTHYRADQLAAHLAGRDVALSHEPEILDTGGGLRAALPLLGPGPVFTLNSDAVWAGAGALGVLVAGWDPARMDALMLLVPPQRAHGDTRAGDFAMDAEGRLSRGGPWRYTGAQIIRTEALAAMPDGAFPLWDIWRGMIGAGRLHGAIYPGHWCDVGHPDGIAAAEAMLTDHV